MKKFIELLESQLGYSEKAGAYTKFGDWYGENIEFDADYTGAPWCDMFLSWAANKLGYEEWMGQFAWTVAHAKWFKREDAWGTKPQPGAFVFYDWSGTNDVDRIDHVGVVTRVEGGRIFTIEGNIDGGVAKRKERDTSKVVGYGYPWKIKERLEEKAAQRVLKEAGTRSADVGTFQPSDQLSTLIPRPGSDLRIPLALPADPAPGARVGSLTNLEAAAPESGRPESSRGESRTESEARPDAPAAAKSAKDAKSAPRSQAGAAGAPSAGQAAASSAPKTGKHAKHSTADTSAATTGPMPAIVDASAATPAAPADSTTLVTSALVAALAVLAITKTRSLRLRPAGRAAAAVAAPAPAPAHRRRKPRKRAAVAAGRDAVELVSPPKRLLDAAEPVSALRSLQDTATPATTPIEPIVIPAAPLAPLPVGAANPVRPIVIPPATSPFNAFARTTDTTGPFAQPTLTDGAVSAAETTGAFARSMLTDGDAAFDAFARPSVRRDGYAGRRRRYERPIEEPGFAADAPPRGRRHRSGGLAPQFLEPFTQDAPLRGRRHRTAAQQARTAAHQQMALTGPPQRQASEDTAPSRGGARRANTRRRGRHRA